MKKNLAEHAAAVLTVAALAGCGNSGNEAAETTAAPAAERTAEAESCGDRGGGDGGV